ncbi:VWA domain-containing protein [Methylobacillus gramineus]|uniref:vWA domain-containing protein n=1 Tax=Methylobacillus gramineus TaxID=755169 RepID=UPI001CFFE9EB|nr:vWA domain-containing protein [Methylobacillus gramineus]MCB5184978.1 VWA domain-containing protein [Methylobacillus gramineus]
MTFLHPWALLLLPLAMVPFWLKSLEGQRYSWLEMVPEDRFSDHINLLLKIVTAIIILSIVLAIASPQGSDKIVRKVGKGAQTVMVIDRSVSMDHPFAGDATSGRAGEIKSTAARRLITRFIDSRPDDMMGVVAFTNSALYGMKITSNRDAIHAAINAATSSGINQTNIGAGITQASTLFDNIQSSGSRAIILLSDGAGKLSPRVKERIKQEIKTKGINLYWIVLREPDDVSIFGKRIYPPDDGPAAIQLDRFFKSLKITYKAYEADNPVALQTAIQDIDSREKNIIQYSVTVPGHDYARDLILLAMILSLGMLVIKNFRVHTWETA